MSVKLILRECTYPVRDLEAMGLQWDSEIQLMIFWLCHGPDLRLSCLFISSPLAHLHRPISHESTKPNNLWEQIGLRLDVAQKYYAICSDGLDLLFCVWLATKYSLIQLRTGAEGSRRNALPTRLDSVIAWLLLVIQQHCLSELRADLVDLTWRTWTKWFPHKHSCGAYRDI